MRWIGGEVCGYFNWMKTPHAFVPRSFYLGAWRSEEVLPVKKTILLALVPAPILGLVAKMSGTSRMNKPASLIPQPAKGV